MAVKQAKNYLISLPTKGQSLKFFRDLSISKINFEILNPHDLGEDWKDVEMDQTVLIHTPQVLQDIDSIVQKNKKTGLFSGFLDDRAEVSLEDLQKIKEQKDFLTGIARNLNSYWTHQEDFKEILELAEKNQTKAIYFGEDVAALPDRIKQKAKQLAGDIQNMNAEMDLDVSNMHIEVVRLSNYQALLYNKEEIGDLEQVIKNLNLEIDVHTFDQLSHKIQEELNNITATLKDANIDPENLSNELVKSLQILHGSLEFENKIAELQNQSFKIDVDSPAKFVLLSIQEDYLDTFLRLIDEYKIPAEAIDWDSEIVNWNNPGGLKSFQDIAQSIGTIDKNEADPTNLLSVFFMVFFAFCLGDALYGLIVSIFTGYFLFFKPLKKEAESIFGLFFYSGLITILLGMLTNSWAGNFFQSKIFTSIPGATGLNSLLQNFQLIDVLNADSTAPINQAIDTSPIIVMLLVAVFIGFLNILSAYYLKISTSLKSAEYSVAFAQFAWIFFIFSIIFWVINSAANGGLDIVATVLISLGLLGILFFNSASNFTGKILGALFGSNGLYGLIQLGADLMSFTRIIAIGLTGGVIATIVNLLADMVFESGGAILGLIAAIIILLVGHTFNFVLSLFGAYINPIRLTYVEFMPKFFVGRARQLEINSTIDSLKHVSIVA